MQFRKHGDDNQEMYLVYDLTSGYPRYSSYIVIVIISEFNSYEFLCMHEEQLHPYLHESSQEFESSPRFPAIGKAPTWPGRENRW